MKNLVYFAMLAVALAFFVFGCQEAQSPTEVPNIESISQGVTGTVWYVPGNFDNIQDAINAAEDGDRIIVGPGPHDGALVTKAVEIKGLEGAIINDGPPHPAGLSQGFRLLAGSDGCTISHLTFTADVDLAIMNGAAVNNVTVTQCTFLNSIQAISNWRGSGWAISHNTITDLRTRCGGGIGILIGDFDGGVVENNVVSHNTIEGTLYVPLGDCGGYNGSAIVLYADFRWGYPGTSEMKNNSVIKNNVSMVLEDQGSINPVDIVAFELTDTRDDIDADPYPVIFNNSIGFNDWRGTTLQMAFTPEELEGENSVSRNLGDNRAFGLHPSLFSPGGN